MPGVQVHAGTTIVARDPAAFTWWRAGAVDHAFQVLGAWMHSPCSDRVRWTAALTPVIVGPSNPCRECLEIVEGPESERRFADGDR